MLNYNLGQRIRSARNSACFTHEALAELIGVSRTAVVHWEAGDSKPTLENLICLAEVLHVSTDYLLGVSGHSVALSNLSNEAVFALERFIEEIRKAE